MLVRMQLAMPRDTRYVGLMRDVTACVLSEFSVAADAADDVKLAITEACANAVRHASGASEYSVRIAAGPSGCEVEVVDLGPGFPPPGLHEPVAGDLESGRGLFLIRSLVDDLQFIREDDETCVRLIKRWPSPLATNVAEEPV